MAYSRMKKEEEERKEKAEGDDDDVGVKRREHVDVDQGAWPRPS